MGALDALHLSGSDLTYRGGIDLMSSGRGVPNGDDVGPFMGEVRPGVRPLPLTRMYVSHFFKNSLLGKSIAGAK